jgi:hypothetical protein
MQKLTPFLTIAPPPHQPVEEPTDPTMSDKKNSRKRKRLPMDMRAKGRKKKKSKAKIDYLTNVDPVILLRIISYLPISSFLDLSQAHTQLRWFVRNYASIICNFSILTRFPSEAKLLVVKEIEGWLVPTNALITIEPGKDTRWVVPGLRLQIHRPGPQFLYFLEKKVLSCSMVERHAMKKFLDELNGESLVVYGGRDYPRWVWLKEMIWYYGIPS